MNAAAVTVCIPAWQAEAFIDRTLHCARAQTLPGIRILVSVDRSDDATVAICRRHACDDRRIEVWEQRERLGWAGNVNFLLDQIKSEFFCLYFHDDLVEPDYVEVLLDALQACPDAASAHCDMRFFGSSDHLVPGTPYQGDVTERLVKFLVGPRKGAPLRSLIRTRALTPAMRLSVGADAGFNAQVPFLLRLLAAGPALYVPRALYRNWFRRSEGVTDGWQQWPIARLVSAQRDLIDRCRAVFDDLDAIAGRRAVLDFALALKITGELQQAAEAAGESVPAQRDAIAYSLRFCELPEGLAELPREPQEWLLAAYGDVVFRQSLYALAQGDNERGFSGLVVALSLNPGNAHAAMRLAGLFRDRGQDDHALALAHRAGWLLPELDMAAEYIRDLS